MLSDTLELCQVCLLLFKFFTDQFRSLSLDERAILCLFFIYKCAISRQQTDTTVSLSKLLTASPGGATLVMLHGPSQTADVKHSHANTTLQQL